MAGIDHSAVLICQIRAIAPIIAIPMYAPIEKIAEGTCRKMIR